MAFKLRTRFDDARDALESKLGGSFSREDAIKVLRYTPGLSAVGGTSWDDYVKGMGELGYLESSEDGGVLSIKRN